MIGINRNTQNVNLGTFPDDTSIWHLLNTTHLPQTSTKCIRTNIYLGRRYNMLFNRDKFELLNCEKNTRTFHCERSQGKQLEGKVSVRDLGIIFEPNGKFNKYITSVVPKGNCM